MINNSFDINFMFHEVALQSTLDGGQAFRWYVQSDNFYRGVIYNRAVSLLNEGKLIHVKINDEKPPNNIKNILKDYFDTSKSYEGFYNKYRNDHCLGPAVRSLKD